jgi:hypothetical protein
MVGELPEFDLTVRARASIRSSMDRTAAGSAMFSCRQENAGKRSAG